VNRGGACAPERSPREGLRAQALPSRLEGSPLDAGRLKMLPGFREEHVFAPIEGALFVGKNGFLDRRAPGPAAGAFLSRSGPGEGSVRHSSL